MSFAMMSDRQSLERNRLRWNPTIKPSARGVAFAPGIGHRPAAHTMDGGMGMDGTWDKAVQEFALLSAAMNIRALKKARLIDEVSLNVVHSSLQKLEAAAMEPREKDLARMLRAFF